MIKISAGAAVASKTAAAAPAYRFFAPEEFAVVEELCEMIIPADEKSAGAKAARVADYIDSTLAEAFEPAEREDFRAGLKPYLDAPANQRLALLTSASLAEKSPGTAAELFFRLLKEHTIRGYYTSRIGIHDDLDYQGNTYQQGEYAGELPGK